MAIMPIITSTLRVLLCLLCILCLLLRTCYAYDYAYYAYYYDHIMRIIMVILCALLCLLCVSLRTYYAYDYAYVASPTYQRLALTENAKWAVAMPLPRLSGAHMAAPIAAMRASHALSHG